MLRRIPCSILRGGTSKGVFLLEKDLPPKGEERDQLLLRLMGSPDIRQIDGLGGAASVTSKVAILAPSPQPDADVYYTFAQVSVDKPVVSYAGNCGNISSGVGPFAIESGLVKAADPETIVRVFNTNTEKIMVEKIQTPNGKVEYQGDYSIAGVPGTAAPVKIVVSDPGATVFDSLLPTGNPADVLEVPDFGRITVSIVDAANPLVFIKASDIGLTGKELPKDIDQNAVMLDLLERIRGVTAQLLGLVEDYRDSATLTPGIPKMTFVAPPDDYSAADGSHISADQIDILSRMMSMQKAHPTYAMTGAMCTAAAAVIPGTIVNELKRSSANPLRLRIGHPSGILESGVDFEKIVDGQSREQVRIVNAYGYRTARMLMTGTAFY